MNRKLEQILGIIGAAAVLLFLGGFTVVTNGLEEATFAEKYADTFATLIDGLGVEEGLTVLKTLGAWFGVTVFIVLILVALATFFIHHNRYPKIAGLFYLLAGLVTLFGSQLVAYPLAFIFFVVAALCFLRKDGANVSSEN
ncbi:DUF4064 domain-containing protein [Enterococcus timonensis]|uniref:DUF4064 domain-containing protein n=1 Tax=Enterococcus timonensis TaxID=1852364 RepID=UPI0008D95EB3|nr:DUF4064 domain-containing protein [Enterococcus timonensis]